MRLNATDDMLSGHEFPITSSELIDEYGANELELQNGSETVEEILVRLGEETYETPEDIQEALLSAVSHKAIGRRFYSDRDPSTLGENGPAQVSF
ncbi:DUF5789 family protein [Haloferacaceae archaeon DSL9]